MSPSASPLTTETVPALLFAIIAAAIHATYGAHYHIVALAPVQDPDWAREGRRAIFSSHRIR